MTDGPVNITMIIDGKEVEALPGEPVIAAADRAGTYIPRFCYHPRMRSVGVCRMCLVEVKGPRGFSLQPACFQNVTPGMEIVTDSEKVKKAQDGVLEFLLANHPLDCPVCDKGGECPLQDQTLAHGPGESRFVEEKNHFAKPIPVSGLVLLDRERCIQCDRCTRFADEVAGEPLITFAGRGNRVEVATFPDLPFSSYFSGNVVQICPVGALTATPYRFKARPWDLEQSESTCTSCSVGCQIVVQSSQNELTRYLGVDSEAVNHSWLCDRGRFSFEAVNSPARVTTPLIRQGTSLVESSWADALNQTANVIKRSILAKRQGDIGVIGGAQLTNEDLYAWTKFAKGVIGTDSVDAQLDDGLDPKLFIGATKVTINEALDSKILIVVTGDLREELPVLFLRVRDAIKNHGLKVIEVSPRPTSITSLAAVSKRYRPGQLSEALASISLSEVATQLGVEGVDDAGAGVAVLGGRTNLAESMTSVSAAIAKLLLRLPKAGYLSALTKGNVHGAIQMGFAPHLLPGGSEFDPLSSAIPLGWRVLPTTTGSGSRAILEKAAKGELDLLVLLGSDPISEFADRSLAERALRGAKFVVSVDSFHNPSSSRADVLLPAAMFSEYSGSTTNIEGRVALVGQRLVPAGVSKPFWLVAAELSEVVGVDLGLSSPEGMWREIGSLSALHRGFSFSALAREREGVVLPIKRDAVTIGGRRKLDPVATPGIASVYSKAPWSAGQVDSADSANSEAGSKWSWADVSLLSRVASNTSGSALPGQALALVVVNKLYGDSTVVENSGHLQKLQASPSIRLSAATATRFGVVGGASVRVTSQYGSSDSVMVTIDDEESENTVSMDFAAGSGVTSLLGPVVNATQIELERI